MTSGTETETSISARITAATVAVAQTITSAVMYDNYHEFQFESASCEVTIISGRGLVHRVYAKDRGRGHGAGLLRVVTEWADENDLELFLRAQGYGHPTQTILDNNQLIEFYEKFGFERTDGDDICMSNIPMLRLPNLA